MDERVNAGRRRRCERVNCERVLYKQGGSYLDSKRRQTLRRRDARQLGELLEEEELQRRRRRDASPHRYESAPERRRPLLRRDLRERVEEVKRLAVYLTLHLTHRGASWASGAAQAAHFVRR